MEIDFDIRRDTMVLDFHLAVEAINGSARRGEAAAIDQFGITADAHQSSPGLFADQRADAGFTEIPRQGIAAGTRHFVDDHDLGPVNRFRWARPVDRKSTRLNS